MTGLQQFDKFWIWRACNDRKRKSCECTETCLEKHLKWHHVSMILADFSHLEPLCDIRQEHIRNWTAYSSELLVSTWSFMEGPNGTLEFPINWIQTPFLLRIWCWTLSKMNQVFYVKILVWLLGTVLKLLFILNFSQLTFLQIYCKTLTCLAIHM